MCRLLKYYTIMTCTPKYIGLCKRSFHILVELHTKGNRNTTQHSLKVRSHQTRMKRINRAIRAKLDDWTFWVYSLQKCIPVFVKVGRCMYSSGYPHTTTITLSSIVVSDFLPPLVMTSLPEQAPDWLTRREYPPKFRFFNSRDSEAEKTAPFASQDCLSRLCIDLTCKSFASCVNAP